MTGHVRNRFVDPLVGVPILRTLGLVTAGDDGKASYRGFGKTGSPRRFGHNGAGGQLAWADPETGLSFVYLTNGLDAHPIRQARRGVALSSIAGVRGRSVSTTRSGAQRATGHDGPVDSVYVGMRGEGRGEACRRPGAERAERTSERA